MELIYEKGSKGRHLDILPVCDVEITEMPEAFKRNKPPALAEVSETEISRHFTKLAGRSYGVNDGFYPLGSCTMKYNPKVNEEAASLKGFTAIHPLQGDDSSAGCLKVMDMLSRNLCEICGMDEFSLQPAAGAHGELTGLLLIKAYLKDKGETGRTKIIVPDSAHGTNPASAVMSGFTVVNVPSGEDGCVDIEALKDAVGDDTAGLMLTNPNTVGLFDKNIKEITDIIHEAGGLCYYDGANLNAIMGICRPGDMGFDVVHVNLHKTFSTPHGGGGPGAGPVGCKSFLADYMPGSTVGEISEGKLTLKRAPKSIGDMKSFHGNFLVAVKALAYILTLGRDGIVDSARNAVLNANYMRVALKDTFDMAYDETCMHEFVMDLGKFKDETGCAAIDIAKGLLDYGMHPPTMYFPLIVHEALMAEPTETEPREMLDLAVDNLKKLKTMAIEDPGRLHTAPHTTCIGRPDEVCAARNPVLKFVREEK